MRVKFGIEALHWIFVFAYTGIFFLFDKSELSIATIFNHFLRIQTLPLCLYRNICERLVKSSFRISFFTSFLWMSSTGQHSNETREISSISKYESG